MQLLGEKTFVICCFENAVPGVVGNDALKLLLIKNVKCYFLCLVLHCKFSVVISQNKCFMSHIGLALTFR